MAELLIGTANGVFRLDSDGRLRQEEGPPAVSFLTHTYEGVLALTKEGALWSRARGDGWHLVHARPISEEVWSLAADPRLSGRIYLGVSPALLYWSDDGGTNWTACEAIRRIPGYETWTFPPPPHIPHVRSVAPDPQAVGAVYIGVEEGGIYRSADRGQTWESLNEGLYWDVHTVTPASDGTRLYATTGRGFYRSDDGGCHWRHLMTGLDRRYTVPLVASRQQPGRLYTAAAATPPPGWRQGANAALYRSDDGGDHWMRLEHGLPSPFEAMVRQIVVDDAGHVFIAAGQELFSSEDDGDSWRRLASDLPTIQALAVV
ncbi:MAG TPA: exo-alpha-sialidase [Candidatus Tectomicrobia bacterium]|nr:exo-alpha-sialidase [Candidatus Tectomicrobia bacterium]